MREYSSSDEEVSQVSLEQPKVTLSSEEDPGMEKEELDPAARYLKDKENDAREDAALTEELALARKQNEAARIEKLTAKARVLDEIRPTGNLQADFKTFMTLRDVPFTSENLIPALWNAFETNNREELRRFFADASIGQLYVEGSEGARICNEPRRAAAKRILDAYDAQQSA